MPERPGDLRLPLEAKMASAGTLPWLLLKRRALRELYDFLSPFGPETKANSGQGRQLSAVQPCTPNSRLNSGTSGGLHQRPPGGPKTAPALAAHLSQRRTRRACKPLQAVASRYIR